MVRIVDEGEGVAQLARTPKTLFQFPPPRLFAAAEMPARGAKSAPAPARPKGYWPGSFVLTAELSWLRDDEAFTIAGLLRMADGRELQPAFNVEFTKAYGGGIWQSPPIYSLYGCAFQAVQTKGAGTVRLPYFVIQVEGR